jgi:hypothetical protein
MDALAKRPRRSRYPRIAASLAATALSLFVGSREGNAQTPARGDTRTVQGTVRSTTTAPLGEIDGAVLDDGTVIHWPPHLGDRMSGLAVRGDQVRATGYLETGPEGDTHLEVRTITNLRTSASFENDAPAPPPPARGPGRRRGPVPPPPPGPRQVGRVGTDAAGTLQGTVQRLTTAPMGEVDGAVLDDGTVIHWPPHLADRFSAVVMRGDRVKVTGTTETGPAGDTHFEVQSATNLRTDSTIGGDDGRPLRPLRFEAAADSSSNFDAPPAHAGNVERRLKALEEQIAQLREEIRRLRRQP